jgi:hypothetical protein
VIKHRLSESVQNGDCRGKQEKQTKKQQNRPKLKQIECDSAMLRPINKVPWAKSKPRRQQIACPQDVVADVVATTTMTTPHDNVVDVRDVMRETRQPKEATSLLRKKKKSA